MANILQPNQSVCFTGPTRNARGHLENLARIAGLRVSGSAYDADVLVYADAYAADKQAVRKVRIAQKRKIPVLSESEFFAQVHASPAPPPLPCNLIFRDWAPKRPAHAVRF